MPIFEFVCETCGERFEEIVSQGADAPACPKCGGKSRQAISAPAPLKTGAFPFKVSPPRPGVNGGCAGPSCGIKGE